MAPSAAPVLSLPDVTSAPGQDVNHLVGKAGLPITLANAAGLTSILFHIDYDPSLLTFSGIVPGSPTGATISADLSTVGHAVFSFSSDTPLGDGPVTIGALLATVPAAAMYGQRQLLRLVVDQTTGLAAGTPPVVGDDALEVLGLLGDTDGNAAYDGGDAGLVQRVVVHANSGFAAWPNVDPTVVADVARIGRLLSIDATRIGQEAAAPGQRWFTPVPAGPMVATPAVLASGLASTSPVARVTAAVVDAADPALADPLQLIKASPPMTIRLAGAFADFTLAPTSASGLDWQEAFLSSIPEDPTTALRKLRVTISHQARCRRRQCLRHGDLLILVFLTPKGRLLVNIVAHLLAPCGSGRHRPHKGFCNGHRKRKDECVDARRLLSDIHTLLAGILRSARRA